MIYSFGWLALVTISLAVSLAAFIWGIGSGQFTEQTRARYLPLRDLYPADRDGEAVRPSRGIFVLLTIIAGGLFIMALPALLTWWY